LKKVILQSRGQLISRGVRVQLGASKASVVERQRQLPVKNTSDPKFQGILHSLAVLFKGHAQYSVLICIALALSCLKNVSNLE